MNSAKLILYSQPYHSTNDRPVCHSHYPGVSETSKKASVSVYLKIQPIVILLVVSLILPNRDCKSHECKQRLSVLACRSMHQLFLSPACRRLKYIGKQYTCKWLELPSRAGLSFSLIDLKQHHLYVYYFGLVASLFIKSLVLPSLDRKTSLPNWVGHAGTSHNLNLSRSPKFVHL